MTEFKIERKKLKIDIYGKVYDISKPRFGEINEFQEQLESMDSKNKFAAIRTHVIKSGVPEDVIDDMDVDSVLELLEIITGSKKN